MLLQVNLLAGAKGNVLRSEIVGSVQMRVFLSGMPELRLGLNDKVLFESTGRCTTHNSLSHSPLSMTLAWFIMCV